MDYITIFCRTFTTAWKTDFFFSAITYQLIHRFSVLLSKEFLLDCSCVHCIKIVNLCPCLFRGAVMSLATISLHDFYWSVRPMCWIDSVEKKVLDYTFTFWGNLGVALPSSSGTVVGQVLALNFYLLNVVSIDWRH